MKMTKVAAAILALAVLAPWTLQAKAKAKPTPTPALSPTPAPSDLHSRVTKPMNKMTKRRAH